MRTSAVLGLALALVPVLTRGAQSPPPPAASPQASTAFPAGVEVVNVDAIVLDDRGNPVEGLTQADFAIKEDGRPQTITSFEAMGLDESAGRAPSGRQRISTNATPPSRGDRWFVVVFDDVNMTALAAPRARDAITDFLDRGLRDGDEVMVVATSGGAWWTGRMPEDRETLTSFVAGLQGLWRPETGPGRIWDHEAIAIANGRDRQLEAEVARRYFENNLIPEAYPQDAQLAAEMNVSPGLSMIRAKAREVYGQAAGRLRATLVTLARVSASLASLRGHKSLLLVSEGFIMDPSQREFRELIQAARNASTAVSFVDVRGPTGALGQAGMAGGGAEFGRAVEERDTTTALALAVAATEGARSVADDTGGAVIEGTRLADGMAGVARQSRAYYLLGYTSSNPARDGKFRRIQVSVGRPKLEVRARRGYYAPSAAPEKSLRHDELDPAVRNGIDSLALRAGIPLRLTSYVFGPQVGGKRQVLLDGEADLGPLRLAPRAGTYSAKLDTYVVVYGHDATEPERQQTQLDLALPAAAYPQIARWGVPIRREFALAPGRYQARLLVKDQATGLIGTVRHEFEVPVNPGLQVTTPILTDSFQAAGAGPPRPVPIAHRTFAPGARLACVFSILGAAADPTLGHPRVTLAYALRRATGAEISSVPARPLSSDPGGQITPALFLELPADAAGEYELAVTIRDEVAKTTLDVVEPFTVERP